MIDHDPNEIEATGRHSRTDRRDSGRDPEINQPVERPYGDADNLYEIPRVRADDPPMRAWWWDEDPHQDDSGPQQNG